MELVIWRRGRRRRVSAQNKFGMQPVSSANRALLSISEGKFAPDRSKGGFKRIHRYKKKITSMVDLSRLLDQK